jgi:enoyl-[acyl-carrier protein] reductase III
MKDGKAAVVTGGTRGIGRAVSLMLARRGYCVYAIYARNREAAGCLERQAALEGVEIHCLRADLTRDDHFLECVSKIKAGVGAVHAIVHCAASGVHRQSPELSLKHLAWTMNVNVGTIHRLVVELLPLVPAGGRIIGITSQGATHALPLYAAIGSSKGALDALFRHYAQEFAPRGIAVNLVCPGMVLTEALDSFPDKENRVQNALSRTPSGRLTTPEDVAATVEFMCSDAAAQIVGQTIVIDGGRALT